MNPSGVLTEVRSVMRQGLDGELPPRYHVSVEARLRELALPKLTPGAYVLDVGSGRRPVLATEARPPDCTYVGFDISAKELESAPRGAYDQVVVGDVVDLQASLSGRFDLVLTWWLLEHVERLDLALENLRQYLRPGGRLIAYFSGRNALGAVVNRLLPRAASERLLALLNAREPETIFPAHYDRCTYRDLTQLGENWCSFEITPLFDNALYLRRVRFAQALYLGYEEWACRSDLRNLATHYLVVADS